MSTLMNGCSAADPPTHDKFVDRTPSARRVPDPGPFGPERCQTFLSRLLIQDDDLTIYISHKFSCYG